MLEDAKQHPERLPPYDGCREDTCQCEYELVLADEVPRGTRVAELVGGQSRQPRQQQKSGCVGVMLAVVVAIICRVLARTFLRS